MKEHRHITVKIVALVIGWGRARRGDHTHPSGESQEMWRWRDGWRHGEGVVWGGDLQGEGTVRGCGDETEKPDIREGRERELRYRVR